MYVYTYVPREDLPQLTTGSLVTIIIEEQISATLTFILFTPVFITTTTYKQICLVV